MIPVSSSTSEVSVEMLADLFVSLFNEFGELGAAKGDYINEFLKKHAAHARSVLSSGTQESDFETVKVLGRGAYGEVRLVKRKDSGKVFAMKLMRKSKLRANKDASGFREERDVMALGNNPWITKLFYAFQDKDFLYLVMEYIQGGNLLTQLYKDDVFEEDTARFYIAETILAVNAVHELGYAHRDVKPENLMIDSKGHIKITDFGTCIKLDENGEARADSAVGTPEYISPEMLQAQDKGAMVGKGADWWSVGIILYELIVGEVPFYSESLLEMYGMIMKYQKPQQLAIPEDVEMSEEAIDLCRKLICRKEDRLDFEGIKKHPFFKSINWSTLRDSTPPFVPEISNELDTSHFEEVDDSIDDPLKDTAPKRKAAAFAGEGLPFIGFSYNRENFHMSISAPHSGSKSSTDEFESLSKVIKEKDKKIGDLQVQNDNLITTLETLKEKMENEQQTAKSLESEKNESQIILKQTKLIEILKKSNLKTRIEKEQAEKQRLEGELAILRESLEELKVEEEKLQQHEEKLIKNETDKTKEVENERDQRIAELEKTNKTLQDEVENLQKSKPSTSTKKFNFADTVRSRMAIHLEIKKTEEEIEKLKQKILKEVEDLLQQTTEKKKDFQKKCEELEMEIKRLQFQMKRAQKQKSEDKSKKVAQNIQFNFLLKKINGEKVRLEKEWVEVKAANDELENELRELEATREKIAMETDALQSANKKIKEERKDARSEFVIHPLQGPIVDSGILEAQLKYWKIGAGSDFQKMFAVLSNQELRLFNSEGDKSDPKKASVLISLKSSVFLVVTNPSEAITHVSASEVAGVFAIYQQDNETFGNDEIKQIAGGHAYEIKLALKPEARPQDLQARLLLMRNEKEKLKWVLALQNLRKQSIS